MAVGAPVFSVRNCRLRDEGPDPGVVGLFAEMRHLFIGYGQVRAQASKAVTDLGESPLDNWSCHLYN
jgi:hypothetical protein